jgi:catechol 2,3-dioxygenase-like lactoylglutathione lyase family enzyme
VNVLFIASIAVVAPDPTRSRALFVDALGLPLEANPGSDYFHSERIGGSKHFGVWPLAEAARACFGSAEWPAERPVPQVSIEFEVESADVVADAAAELRGRGFELLHDAREEPWGRRSPGFSQARARSSASRMHPRCTRSSQMPCVVNH